jgi:hypothetical protein
VEASARLTERGCCLKKPSALTEDYIGFIILGFRSRECTGMHVMGGRSISLYFIFLRPRDLGLASKPVPAPFAGYTLPADTPPREMMYMSSRSNRR